MHVKVKYSIHYCRQWDTIQMCKTTLKWNAMLLLTFHGDFKHQYLCLKLIIDSSPCTVRIDLVHQSQFNSDGDILSEHLIIGSDGLLT